MYNLDIFRVYFVLGKFRAGMKYIVINTNVLRIGEEKNFWENFQMKKLL